MSDAASSAYEASSAHNVLLRASTGCLQMICAYYDVEPHIIAARHGVHFLTQAKIPLETVVRRHLPLLRLDQAMREEAKAISDETTELEVELQREETHDLVARIAWYNPQLRIYRQISCEACSTYTHRTDVTFVRVWPKSVTVRLAGHPHRPQRERLHFFLDGRVIGHHVSFDESNLSNIIQVLGLTQAHITSVLPLPGVLQSIVLPYIGLRLVLLPNDVVDYDPE